MTRFSNITSSCFPTFSYHREQKIWPQIRPRRPSFSAEDREGKPSKLTVMLATKRGEQHLAVEALFARFVLDPVVSRKSLWNGDSASPSGTLTSAFTNLPSQLAKDMSC